MLRMDSWPKFYPDSSTRVLHPGYDARPTLLAHTSGVSNPGASPRVSSVDLSSPHTSGVSTPGGPTRVSSVVDQSRSAERVGEPG
ncbi:hypothetical protein DY000_02004139 [Brassica cretica]|uniref:DET1- and DDB1-associated protein 1 n=1 Tax=Brassica cretica TaxID=69181 RepID=A0ABQ7CJV7_BRACR|nr:hypothetical protein DY000_02004139 [Brassica cretica]